MTVKKNIIIPVTMSIIVITLMSTSMVLPVKQWLIDGLQWVSGLGLLGIISVIIFYVVACVLFLPGSVITLGVGFIFKLGLGTVVVSIGSTLGACAAFLIGRTIVRNWISQKIGSNKKFSAIDHAIGESGFKIVMLTRLSPVFPFNLLNYAFGLTKVSFTSYALASWIGMLPGTVMYVYIGASLRNLSDITEGQVETGRAGQIFYILGLVATVMVTLLITKIAKKALKDTIGS